MWEVRPFGGHGLHRLADEVEGCQRHEECGRCQNENERIVDRKPRPCLRQEHPYERSSAKREQAREQLADADHTAAHVAGYGLGQDVEPGHSHERVGGREDEDSG